MSSKANGCACAGVSNLWDSSGSKTMPSSTGYESWMYMYLTLKSWMRASIQHLSPTKQLNLSFCLQNSCYMYTGDMNEHLCTGDYSKFFFIDFTRCFFLSSHALLVGVDCFVIDSAILFSSSWIFCNIIQINVDMWSNQIGSKISILYRYITKKIWKCWLRYKPIILGKWIFKIEDIFTGSGPDDNWNWFRLILSSSQDVVGIPKLGCWLFAHDILFHWCEDLLSISTFA